MNNGMNMDTNNMNNTMNNNFDYNYNNMSNNNCNRDNMNNNNNINDNFNQFNEIMNNKTNYQGINNMNIIMNNNMNNINGQTYLLNAQYQQFKMLLSNAKKLLENKNNVNHDLYEEYQKEENNFKKNSGNQSFQTTFRVPTDKQNVELQFGLKVSNYEMKKADVENITEKEKNTTIAIFGTKLQDKGGDFILSVLENFKMGYEEGQTMYDIVYIPIKKKDNNNKYFVVNFRKSLYIKNFNDAMLDYLNKNEPNNKYAIYWYVKQGDEFRKYLDKKKKKKKNYKGFIKYL